MRGFNPLCGVNKLKRNGGVGYTQKVKAAGTVTFDIPFYEDLVANGGIVSAEIGHFARVLDRAINKTEVKSFSVHEGGEALTVDSESCDIAEDGALRIWFVSEMPLIISVIADAELWGATFTKGTYAPFVGGDFYVTAIDGVLVDTETVHTIDPKYLPEGGVALPVVELTTLPSISGVQLTAEENAQVAAAIARKLPVVVRFFDIERKRTAAVFLWQELGESGGLLAQIASYGFIIQPSSDGFSFMVVPTA